MKKSDFYGLVNIRLGGIFKEIGYVFCEDTFFRNRENGLRDFVCFDFGYNSTYRVSVGIDYNFERDFNESSPPPGSWNLRYFTGGSLSEYPKDFFFKNDESLTRHLDRFKKYFSEQMYPEFFCSIQSLEDFADTLPIMQCLERYRIYRREGAVKKAVLEGKIVLEEYEDKIKSDAFREAKKEIDSDVIPFLKSHSNEK